MDHSIAGASIAVLGYDSLQTPCRGWDILKNNLLKTIERFEKVGHSKALILLIPGTSRRNGMGHARSSDGENTGKRDNAQSSAARPAVIANHDLTRGMALRPPPRASRNP